jgi:predicted metal-dependent HD superfamily phosphohydrolase
VKICISAGCLDDIGQDSIPEADRFLLVIWRKVKNSNVALRDRWHELLRKFSIQSQVGDRVFGELERLYSRSDRFYHNLAHIQQVLEAIASLQLPACHLEAIEFAAWFHDVIYDSRACDNEENSAAYAEKILSNLNIPKATIDSVKNLILLTKNHQCLETHINGKILLDADLSILGKSEAEYRDYARAIRQEYSWVITEEYRQGRKLFLENLLRRERIYLTEEIFAACEEKARQNMQEEIRAIG